MPAGDRYERARDLDSWRSDRRIEERGFAHPWVSRVDEGNGEDFFVAVLSELVQPDSVVLDLGCGHGELTIEAAARARRAIGVDRDTTCLELGRELADERGLDNVAFVEFSFDGKSQLPLADRSVSVVVNRRGPVASRWIDDILRVARPGSPVLVMHPAGGAPQPPWIHELPAWLQRWFGSLAYDEVRSWIEPPLASNAITDYQLHWFDVTERFDSAQQLAQRVTFTAQDPPGDLADATTALQRVFDAHAVNELALRHQRLVARFRLPDRPC